MKENHIHKGQATYNAAQTKSKTILTPVAYFAYMIPFHSPSIEQKDFLSFGELNKQTKKPISISLKFLKYFILVSRKWSEEQGKAAASPFHSETLLSRSSLLRTAAFRGCVDVAMDCTHTHSRRLHQSSGMLQTDLTMSSFWRQQSDCQLCHSGLPTSISSKLFCPGFYPTLGVGVAADSYIQIKSSWKTD